MSESGSRDEYVVGDRVVFIVLSIYGESKVTTHPELFATQDSSLLQEERIEWAYVVTYIYMADFYGPNATRFYASPYFHNLYTNGMLTMFRNARHT